MAYFDSSRPPWVDGRESVIRGHSGDTIDLQDQIIPVVVGDGTNKILKAKFILPEQPHLLTLSAAAIPSDPAKDLAQRRGQDGGINAIFAHVPFQAGGHFSTTLSELKIRNQQRVDLLSKLSALDHDLLIADGVERQSSNRIAIKFDEADTVVEGTVGSHREPKPLALTEL